MKHILKTAIMLLGFLLILSVPILAQDLQGLKIVNVSRDVYESEKISQELDAGDIRRFVFQANGVISGNINIVSSESDHKMSYVLHFKARSMEQAQEFAEYITIEQDKSGDDLNVTAQARKESPWQGTSQSARLDIQINLPESTIVELNAVYFDINIEGPFQTARVINEFGRVRVSNVMNGLSVVTDNSYVRVTDIQGKVDISTSNNKIRAENINTGSETAVFKNEFGLIEISRFSGVMKCETSNGPIDIRGVTLTEGHSTVSTTYSAIDAELIALENASLHLEDNFSNVSVVLPEDLEARFDINVDRGGRILLSGIPVVPIELDRERLIARTDNPDSKISVDLEGIGTVNIKGQKFFTTP